MIHACPKFTWILVHADAFFRRAFRGLQLSMWQAAARAGVTALLQIVTGIVMARFAPHCRTWNKLPYLIFGIIVLCRKYPIETISQNASTGRETSVPSLKSLT